MAGDEGEGDIPADSFDRLVVGLAEAAGSDGHDHLADLSRLGARNLLESEHIEVLQHRSQHGRHFQPLFIPTLRLQASGLACSVLLVSG
jgi:hypothetical protein